MVNSIIPHIPDWILFIVVFAIGIIIYFYLPDSAKKPVKTTFVNYGVYIVGAMIWLYWRSRTTLVSESIDKWPATMNRATFFILLFFLIYFGLKSWLYEFRYYTNHFSCDNIHGSCHRFQEIGSIGEDGNNWVVLFLGGSGLSDEKFVIPWPWVKRIVVVPKSACQFLGNQIIAFSQVEKIEAIDLPEDVADFINNDPFGRWCKDEIYFGLWDISKKSKNPKYMETQKNMEKLNATINKQKEMLKGNLSTMKTFVSDTMGMSDKLKGKDWRNKQQNNPPQD